MSEFIYISYINIHLEKKNIDLKTGFLKKNNSEDLLKSNRLYI